MNAWQINARNKAWNYSLLGKCKLNPQWDTSTYLLIWTKLKQTKTTDIIKYYWGYSARIALIRYYGNVSW